MQTNMNIFSILIQSGLVVQLVLLILILASVFSWAIIFMKYKTLNKVESDNEKFHEIFKNAHNLSDVYTETSNFKNSPLAVMYQKGYIEINKIKEKLNATGNMDEFKTYIRSNGIQAIERSLQQGIEISNQKIDEKLSFLASIGSIAPFIGLFGTVWGIINSFTGLASGGGSIEAVAPGIAEALVATAVGLAAAIPATWAYNLFLGRTQKINTDMNIFSQDFLNLIERSFLITKA